MRSTSPTTSRTQSVDLLKGDDDIAAVAGQQGGFTELALNGGAGGIGDGHPALQDINVRHAIYYAIDRDVLFDRVALGLGASRARRCRRRPTRRWVPDLGDELYTYDPAQANQILDDAGYLDTDGDGVREMPDGSRPLEFRYAERSESTIAAPIREFVTGWLHDIGIATDGRRDGRHPAVRRQSPGRLRHVRLGLDAVRRPRPDAVVLHVRPGHHRCSTRRLNDANWCSEDYDALYEQQKVELDPDKRRDIVHRDAHSSSTASRPTSCCSGRRHCRRTAPTASRAG